MIIGLNIAKTISWSIRQGQEAHHMRAAVRTRMSFDPAIRFSLEQAWSSSTTTN